MSRANVSSTPTAIRRCRGTSTRSSGMELSASGSIMADNASNAIGVAELRRAMVNRISSASTDVGVALGR